MMPTAAEKRLWRDAFMFSIPHMIVLFIIVLVIFGPQKLPELARGLGKLMAEFRKASTDFKSAFEQEMREMERQTVMMERKKAAEAAAAAAAAVQPATLATPSGAETSPAPSEHSDSVDSTEKRATEAPVIAPAAGTIARSAEPETQAGMETISAESERHESKQSSANSFAVTENTSEPQSPNHGLHHSA